MARPSKPKRPSIIERKLADSGIKLEGRVLSRQTPVSGTTIHGKGAIVFGSVFVATGVFIALMVTGVIPAESKGPDAPAWLGVLFGSIFAVAGLWVMVHGLRGVLRRRWSTKMKVWCGDEVWRADYKWNDRGARDMQKRGVGQMLFGLLFMTLFAAPFNFIALEGLKEGSKVGLAFTCVNLFVLIFAIAFVYRLARWMKYGTGQVCFHRFPYFLGEKLILDYIPARRLPPISKLTCTLRCIRETYVTTQSGGKTSTDIVCSALYEDVVEIAGETVTSSFDRAIPLTFDLPADAPTTCLAEMPPVYWQLEVHAETPGVDLDSRFLLPVYARPGAAPKHKPDDGGAKAANQLKARLVEAVAAQR